MLWQSIRELEPLRPTFVSVTYGAGGTTRDRHHPGHRADRAGDVADPDGAPDLRRPHRATSCARSSAPTPRPASTTCWRCAATRRTGRGTPWTATEGGLNYATELVELVQSLGDFCVGVAAFPEGHRDAASLEADAQVLRRKHDAGADFAITQMFFRAVRLLRPGRAAAPPRGRHPDHPGDHADHEPPLRSSGWPSCPGATCLPRCWPGSRRVTTTRPRCARIGIEVATELCDALLAGGAPGPALLHAEPVQGDARDLRGAGVAGLSGGIPKVSMSRCPGACPAWMRQCLTPGSRPRPLTPARPPRRPAPRTAPRTAARHPGSCARRRSRRPAPGLGAEPPVERRPALPEHAVRRAGHDSTCSRGDRSTRTSSCSRTSILCRASAVTRSSAMLPAAEQGPGGAPAGAVPLVRSTSSGSPCSTTSWGRSGTSPVIPRWADDRRDRRHGAPHVARQCRQPARVDGHHDHVGRGAPRRRCARPTTRSDASSRSRASTPVRTSTRRVASRWDHRRRRGRPSRRARSSCRSSARRTRPGPSRRARCGGRARPARPAASRPGAAARP